MDEIRPMPPKILVVDDERHLVRLAENVLEEAGYVTDHAYDGAEALAWLSDHPAPALVVLDIMMPRIDGFEVLEAMRKDARLASVPVIMLTSIPSDFGPLRDWSGLPTETWLYKPFQPADLLATVAWNLSDRTARAPEMSRLSPWQAVDRKWPGRRPTAAPEDDGPPASHLDSVF